MDLAVARAGVIPSTETTMSLSDNNTDVAMAAASGAPISTGNGHDTEAVEMHPLTSNATTPNGRTGVARAASSSS